MTYSNSTKEISNSIFVRTKLFHRSNSSLFDHFNFKFSTFNDFDIGGPSDDYMGTDTIRKMVSAYNSRNIDIGSNQIKGYSKNLAAQAVKFLNSPLAGSMEHIDPFTGLRGAPEKICDSLAERPLAKWSVSHLWRRWLSLLHGQKQLNKLLFPWKSGSNWR